MPGPSDDQLLRMLHEVEDVAVARPEDLEDVPSDAPLDPCPFCGEPAEALDECLLCGEPGCLPPELWTPGRPDNCLTLCVRCARTVHLACTIEDEAGNPRCPTCPF